MKHFRPFSALIFTLLLMTACKDTPKEESVNKPAPAKEVAQLEQSFKGWWTYQYNNIDLSSNFVGLDEQGEEIDTETFFREMVSGEFIPVKVDSDSGPSHYQLQQLGEEADEEIRNEVKRLAGENLNNFRKLGTEFPEFDFVDLEGNHYTNELLKGKTVVFKAWFIACKPCVEEFPELNELVSRYRDSEDVVFISLALDQKEELKEFLSKEPFQYKVIPDQKDYLMDVLEVIKYPTHIVVDKNGNYQSIPRNAESLIAFLGQSDIAVQKELKGTPAPPPPPM